MYLDVHFHESVHLPIHAFIYTCRSIYLSSIHMSINFSIYLSIHPSIHTSISIFKTHIIISINLFCSQPLLTKLRTLFDLIVDFQSKQDSMFISFLAEAEKRKEYAIIKEQRSTGVCLCLCVSVSVYLYLCCVFVGVFVCLCVCLLVCVCMVSRYV